MHGESKGATDLLGQRGDIAITNAGTGMAEMFLCKKRKKGRRNSAEKTAVKAAESLSGSKNSY